MNDTLAGPPLLAAAGAIHHGIVICMSDAIVSARVQPEGTAISIGTIRIIRWKDSMRRPSRTGNVRGKGLFHRGTFRVINRLRNIQISRVRVSGNFAPRELETGKTRGPCSPYGFAQ